MRRLFILIVLTIAVFAISRAIYVFQDTAVFWKEIEGSYSLKNGERIVYAEGGKWWLERAAVSWDDVLKKVKLTLVEELPKGGLNLISSSPLVLRGEDGTFYVYMSKLGKWFSFKWDGNFESVVKTDGKIKALMACPGNWSALYTLKGEKELSLTVKVFSKCVDSGHVYLVTGRFEEEKKAAVAAFRAEKGMGAAPPAPAVTKAFERRIFDIGDLQGLSRGAGVEVFDTFLNSVERVFTLDFPVSTSTPFEKAVYTLVIENSRGNGLGFSLPDGNVLVFKDMEGESVPVGNFTFKGCEEGDMAYVIENETPSVLGRVVLLNNKRLSNDRFLRTLKIELKNLKDEGVRVLIRLHGNMMELKSSDVVPEYVSSDEIGFLVDLAPGKEEFQLTVETSW